MIKGHDAHCVQRHMSHELSMITVMAVTHVVVAHSYIDGIDNLRYALLQPLAITKWLRYGKRCFENGAVSLPFPSGAEVDFVCVFTVDFAHRDFTSLIKTSFRPIIYRGIASSPFSSLRPHYTDGHFDWKNTILYERRFFPYYFL